MLTNEQHAARLRELAEIENSGELMFAAVGDKDAAAYSRSAKAAMLAGAEALERAVWRPISEAHEDFGPVVLIDMADPGSVELAHVCDLHWWKKAEGMTHFAQLPLLTEAIATAALARLEGK